jgi:hypothetical protein
MGDLNDAAAGALTQGRVLLDALEITRMTRSYKMLVILAMLNADALPGPGLAIDDLCSGFVRLARRNPRLAAEVGDAIQDPKALWRLLEEQPIQAWVGESAVPGGSAFEYSDGVFRYKPTVPSELREAFQKLVRELVDWRLAEYLSRESLSGEELAFSLKLSHSGGRPILFLPEREKSPGLPSGWTTVSIEGEAFELNFVKVAVNQARRSGDSANQLPALMRAWFGPDAGMPGTDHEVILQGGPEGWTLRPSRLQETKAIELFRRYPREQIAGLLGDSFTPARWNAGFVVITPEQPRHLVLLVTLDKQDMPGEFSYGDRFLGNDRFQWQSQNRTDQEGKHGRLIRAHESLGIPVHLFVRKTKKRNGGAAPFVYCGPVCFEEWEGDRPITVRWRLEQPIGSELAREFGVGAAE